jgi:hypothetical protein
MNLSLKFTLVLTSDRKFLKFASEIVDLISQVLILASSSFNILSESFDLRIHLGTLDMEARGHFTNFSLYYCSLLTLKLIADLLQFFGLSLVKSLKLNAQM